MIPPSQRECDDRVLRSIPNLLENESVLEEDNGIIAYDTGDSEDDTHRLLNVIKPFIEERLSESVHILRDMEGCEKAVTAVMKKEDRVNMIFARQGRLIVKKLSPNERDET